MNRRNRRAAELPPPAPRPQELAAHRATLRTHEGLVFAALDHAARGGHAFATLAVLVTPRDDAFIHDVVGSYLMEHSHPVHAIAFQRANLIQVFEAWSPTAPGGKPADVVPYAELGMRLRQPGPAGSIPVVVSDGATAMVQYVDVGTA